MKATSGPSGSLDRIGALAAACLVASWAISDRYLLIHWWSPAYLVFAGASVLLLLVGARVAPWLALATAMFAGIEEQLWRAPVSGSDALAVVKEAIAVLAAGKNPYLHEYAVSIPAELGVGYPPGMFLVYWPFVGLAGDLRAVERVSGILVVMLLAALAWRAGPGRAALACALYGTFGLAALRAIDGSNDTTLALLVLLGIVLLAYGTGPTRRARFLYWASVAPLAAALLFKQLAWPVYAFLALWLWRSSPAGRRHVAVTLGIAVAITAPFVLWDPGAFLSHVVLFPRELLPRPLWGLNVWATLNDLNPPLVAALEPVINPVFFAVVGATAIVFARRPARHLAGALAQGIGVLFVSLFLARWTTSPWYTYGFALLCGVLALAPLGETEAADRPQEDGLRREHRGAQGAVAAASDLDQEERQASRPTPILPTARPSPTAAL